MLNNGNTAATDVTFTDTPDANTTLVVGSVRSDYGTIITGNNAGDSSVSITLGEVDSGLVVNISFRVTINAPLPNGVMQVENQGTISGDGIPDSQTDDPDTPIEDDPTVTPVVATPILVASKRDSLINDTNGDGFAGPGDMLTYQIVLLNNGNAAAEDVVLNDMPDANTTLINGSVQTDLGIVTLGNSAGDSTITIDIGTLLPGSMVNISFQVMINDPLPLEVTSVENQGIFGTSTITGTVPTDDPDTPEPNDPTVTPVGQAQIAITKRAVPGEDVLLNFGDTVAYFVTVTNTGSITLTNLVITDSIPAGTTYVADSATPAPEGGSDPLVWLIPSLSIGQSTTVGFEVTVNVLPGATTIRNVALIENEQVPITPSNETVHNVIEPTALDEVDEPGSGYTDQIFIPVVTQ